MKASTNRCSFFYSYNLLWESKTRLASCNPGSNRSIILLQELRASFCNSPGYVNKTNSFLITSHEFFASLESDRVLSAREDNKIKARLAPANPLPSPIRTPLPRSLHQRHALPRPYRHFAASLPGSGCARSQLRPAVRHTPGCRAHRPCVPAAQA